MPLFNKTTNKNGLILSIWAIEESENELLAYFNKDSWIYDELKKIAHPQKRIEYLASRVLVKLVCKDAQISFSGIFKNEHHKPYLIGDCGHISISHTEKYCAVVYHPNNPIGVDIQIVTPKLLKVAKKFLTQDELQILQNDTAKLCLAWCAKESVYKHIGIKGVSLRNQIRIIDFNSNFMCINACFESMQTQIKVYFIQFEGFSVGYTDLQC